MSLLSRLRLLVTAGRGLVRGLPAADERRDPLELFRSWLRAAEEAGLFLPEAVALATATADGAPSVRMVLLKEVDRDGFVFYTNYGSRKAREMDENARASLCFHWAVLQRQVRIEGTVARTTREESERYFRSRPLGSRIGAWASRQSDVLDSRSSLEARVREVEARYRDGEIPLPPFWGGYRLLPLRIEFWQGKPSRLHDRLVFRRDGPDDPWETLRLQP